MHWFPRNLSKLYIYGFLTIKGTSFFIYTKKNVMVGIAGLQLIPNIDLKYESLALERVNVLLR